MMNIKERFKRVRAATIPTVRGRAGSALRKYRKRRDIRNAMAAKSRKINRQKGGY